MTRFFWIASVNMNHRRMGQALLFIPLVSHLPEDIQLEDPRSSLTPKHMAVIAVIDCFSANAWSPLMRVT